MRIIFKQGGCFLLVPSYITGGSYIFLGTLSSLCYQVLVRKEGGGVRSEVLFIKVEIGYICDMSYCNDTC